MHHLHSQPVSHVDFWLDGDSGSGYCVQWKLSRTLSMSQLILSKNSSVVLRFWLFCVPLLTGRPPFVIRIQAGNMSFRYTLDFGNVKHNCVETMSKMISRRKRSVQKHMNFQVDNNCFSSRCWVGPPLWHTNNSQSSPISNNVAEREIRNLCRAAASHHYILHINVSIRCNVGKKRLACWNSVHKTSSFGIFDEITYLSMTCGKERNANIHC